MVQNAELCQKASRKFRVRVSSLQRWSKETVRTSLVFEGGSGEVGRARSRCPRRTLPPPRSLTSVLSSLGRPCARAARCADALAVVLNSSRHLRSVIVDRSIGVCSCVVGAGRENLEWNFYTPRSFDGPHRSIFDLSIGILQKFVCGVRVAREIYTVHRPQNSFVLRKNDPVNKKRFRVGWRRGEPKQQHRSSWRRTGQVNQEAEVCEP